MNMSDMGGAQGLSYGGVGESGFSPAYGAGFAPSSYAADPYSLAPGAAASGYDMGAGPGAGGMAGTDYGDAMRRRMNALGYGPGRSDMYSIAPSSMSMAGAGGAPASPMSPYMEYLKMGLGGMQVLGGLQQIQQNREQQAMMRERQAQQNMYAQQIQQLQANPSSVESLPGYRAGLRAVQRAARAEGFGGSGTMAAALAGYGGQQYQRQLANLAALQGPAASYTAPSNIGAYTNLGAGIYGLGSSMNRLGYLG